MVQLVLLERIAKLGGMGDVVSVKPGYARNFLLPSKKALRATEANIKKFEFCHPTCYNGFGFICRACSI